MEKFLAQTKQSSRSSSSQPTAESSSKDNGSSEAAVRKPLPKGVVLGKDGKPCRTCTDVSAWMAMTRGSKSSIATSTTTSSSTSQASASTATSQTSNCPPDVAELGRSTWTLLHSLAASYPSQAAPAQQAEMSTFLRLFSKLYPCWVCAEDFQAWMTREKPVLKTRAEFGDWMCRAHNEVNRKLGKEEFDCKRWEERWRTGWKDGSCD